MMRFIVISFFAVLFLVYSCGKRNPDNFTLITSGYGGTYCGLDPNPEKISANKIVAARWGIDFYWRGCVISNNTEWEDFKNNWEAEKNIEDKFGEDWIEKFNKEVDAEYALEKYKEKSLQIPKTSLVENNYPTTQFGNLGLSFKFISDTLKSKLNKIVVLKQRKTYQEIIANKEIFDKEFDLIDWNFDGYKDISVLCNAGSGGYNYWIWNYDPRSKKFIYNNTLSDRLGLEQDPKAKLIVIHYREGWPSETWDYYLYKNDKLHWTKGIYENEYYSKKGGVWQEKTVKTKVKNKIITSVKKLKVDGGKYGVKYENKIIKRIK